MPPATASSAVQAPNPSAAAPRDARQLGEAQTAEELRRNQASLRALTKQRADLAPEDYQAQLEELRSQRATLQRGARDRNTDPATTPPESIGGQAPDDLTVVGEIEPLAVTIERNGLNAADTASISIAYDDAPFDPRILRACGIEIVIGVVAADDFEAGMEREERQADGSLRSLVRRPSGGDFIGTTRFVGFVDDWAVAYSEQGDTISLECRDMSAPLRDLKINPGDSIDLLLPLDEGIERFLAAVSPTTEGVRVTYLGEGSPPVPADALAPTRRPRRGARARRQRRGGQNMTLWDHITDVARSVGFIPMLDGYSIVIAEARTLYSSLGSARMVYGRNVEKLDFTRRLQGVKVPTIEVRAYDPTLGRTRWARYPVRSGEPTSGVFGEDRPPRPLRPNEVTPSGANPTESIRVLSVSGVVDPDVLSRVARNAFEQLGRQEIEGSLATSDVSSLGLDPTEADLLDLRVGEPIEVLIAAGAAPGTEEEEPNNTLARLQAQDRQRREQYLRTIGWGEDVARRFAALQDASGFQTVFRTQNVRVAWSNNEGVKLEIGFVNYVTVREDAAA
jgi:hypothetical protein